MSRPSGKLVFNDALLSGAAMKDPYGNTITLMVLYYTGPGDNRFAFYVQGDMYETGDIRQFIIMAPSQEAAIETYDVQLCREHKLAGKSMFDTISHCTETRRWSHFAPGMTFAEWWRAQPLGTRWCSARNFTPDVCIQLTV